MSKRDAAMKKLQTAKFALLDWHLYLDTHPEDLEAIGAYKRAQAKYDVLLREYEEQYGAIDWLAAPGVAWFKNPWPWDSEVCD